MTSVKTSAPIAYFAFNRPLHTRQSLEALLACEHPMGTPLHLFVDGPRIDEADEGRRAIEEVRQIIRGFPWDGPKILHLREENAGLAKSLLAGISEILEQKERVIVIEDDMVPSRGFLSFLNEALDYYSNDERVMHVSARCPVEVLPSSVKESTVVLNVTTVGWGWATWARAWNKLEANRAGLRKRIRKSGRRHLANVRWTFDTYWATWYVDHGFSEDWNSLWQSVVTDCRGVCIHPAVSLARNIGFDGSGTQCAVDEREVLRRIADSCAFEPVKLAETRELVDAYLAESETNRMMLRVRSLVRDVAHSLLGDHGFTRLIHLRRSFEWI